MLRNSGETIPARGGTARFLPKQFKVQLSADLAAALGWNSPQELSVASFLHSEDQDEIVETLRSISAGHLPGAVSRIRVSDLSGDFRTLDWSFFRDPDPDVVSGVGMLVTYGERVNTARLLKEVVEGMHDGFAIYDLDDRLILSNQAYRSALPGYGPAQLNGLEFAQIAELCHKNGNYGDLGKDCKEFLSSRIAAHKSGQSLTFRTLASGRVERIEERRLPSGHIVAVHADVTDLHRENAASKQKASATLDYISVLSHELRTPLVGLLGMLDELGQTTSVKDQSRIMNIMRRSGEQLLSIANTTLDLAKIEQGQMELSEESFDPADDLRSVVERYALVARNKNVGLVADVEDVGFRIGDPMRFLQIVENLLSNAVKFTDQGKVTVSLRKDTDGAIEIKVSDTGIGIPSEFLSRMMKPFTQVDATLTRKYGGTGLGLSVASNLVQLMGGKIDCTSVFEQGTRFTVRLPLKSPSAAIAPEPDRKAARPQSFAGKRVLIADDNEINRILLDRLLSKMQFSTVMAIDGEEALSKAMSGSFDLVVLDISMPKIDGVEVLLELRKRSQYRKTPILAVTANVFEHEVAAYKEAGFDDCLIKPFRREDLAVALQRLLRPDA